MRISIFLIPLGYGYLTAFLFWYHSGLYAMQKPLYLGKIILVSIWVRMVLTQIITRAYKDSVTLTCSLNINMWLELQFWYWRVGSLITGCWWLLVPCIPLYTSPTLDHTSLYQSRVMVSEHGLNSNFFCRVCYVCFVQEEEELVIVVVGRSWYGRINWRASVCRGWAHRPSFESSSDSTTNCFWVCSSNYWSWGFTIASFNIVLS